MMHYDSESGLYLPSYEMGAHQQGMISQKIASGGGSDTPFITSFTPGTPRNAFLGCVGFEFIVGAASITVTALGRWKLAGNTQTHTVYILNSGGGGGVVVSGSVDLTTGSASSFVYDVSITPTALSASTQYFCVSSETSAGDTWLDETGSSYSVASYATLGQASYQPACIGDPISILSAGNSYVPTNFRAH